MTRRRKIAAGLAGLAAAAALALPLSLSQGGSIDVFVGSTPTPVATDCSSGTAYTPDSDDPWGDCWPGPDTTGVPTGTSLTAYSGSCTITTANTTITAKTVNCNPLVIRTSGVQITDSVINGHVGVDSDSYPNAYSFSITDSDVVQGTARANIHGDEPFGIGKSNFVATRVHVVGGIRAVWCEYNCTIQDSYLCCQAEDDNGSLTCTTPAGTQHTCIHESGIRMGSGPNIDEGQVIQHNTVACDADDFVDPNPGGNDSSGCSASMTGYGDFATIQFNTMHRNLWIDTKGGTCVYGGSTSGKPFPNANHIVFTENYFRSRASTTKCGSFFSSADYNASGTGNVWTGNKRWTGSSLVDLSPNQ